MATQGNIVLSELCKFRDDGSELTIDTDSLKQEASVLGDQYVSLLDEVSKFETYINNIMENAALLSDKCCEANKDIAKIGNTIAEYGVKRIQKTGSYNKQNLTTVGIGMAISAGAELYNRYKQNQIKMEEERQLLIILEKKQEYAAQHYDSIIKLIAELSEKKDEKIFKLYKQQFDKELDCQDPMFRKQLKMFEFSFCMFVKFQYMLAILVFLKKEMQAWQHGSQESNASIPSLKKILDNEMNNWSDWLIGSHDVEKWDSYVEEILRSDRTTYPPAVCMLFTNPYLLKNYVGVFCWPENTYVLGDISGKPTVYPFARDLSDNNGTINYFNHAYNENVMNMLETNEYYKEMKEFACSAEWFIPEPIGIMDHFVLLCIFIGNFIVSTLFFFVVMSFGAGLLGNGVNGAWFALGIVFLLALRESYKRKSKDTLLKKIEEGLFYLMDNNKDKYDKWKSSLINGERAINEKFNNITI